MVRVNSHVYNYGTFIDIFFPKLSPLRINGLLRPSHLTICFTICFYLSSPALGFWLLMDCN